MQPNEDLTINIHRERHYTELEGTRALAERRVHDSSVPKQPAIVALLLLWLLKFGKVAELCGLGRATAHAVPECAEAGRLALCV